MKDRGSGLHKWKMSAQRMRELMRGFLNKSVNGWISESELVTRR